jgi:DNA-binding NtrC family response regulator
VAESDLSVRHLMTVVLTRAGVRVVPVPHLDAAVAVCENDPAVCAAIVDASMAPRPADAFAHLGAARPRFAVLLVGSGDTQPAGDRVARLDKPFTTSELLRAVEHLVAVADPGEALAGT